MHPLYQRLRELDPNTFERLCFHLEKERHPHADIHHVEGAAGDDGIDCFAGDLDGGPTVWQVKAFSNGIKKSQRENVRESLRRAMERAKPREWILCVPVDLDAGTHRWFQKLAKSYSNRVKIGLLDAGTIVHGLLTRRSVREAFFPHAVLDSEVLRQVLAKTGELTLTELSDLSTDNVERYIDRLQAADARFRYEVVYGGGETANTGPPRGLVASVSAPDRTINIFANDVEALRRDPPKASFSLAGAGIDKIKAFIRTGKRQMIDQGEIVGFSSDFDFLRPAGEFQSPLQLMLGPSAAARERVPLRITFGKGESATVFEYVEFVVARAGTDEIELLTTEGQPLTMSICFGQDLACALNISYAVAGVDVRIVRKVFRALSVMASAQPQEIELFDLKSGKVLGRGLITSTDLTPPELGLVTLIEHAARVADFYGLDLELPETPAAEDYATLEQLHGLIDGILIRPERLTMRMVKTQPVPIDAIAGPGGRAGSFRFQMSEMQPCPRLFGVPVRTGPVLWQLEGTAVRNLREALAIVERATIGDSLTLVFEIEGPVLMWALGPSAE